ncbi:unnamed protein product, partial [Chrysoparadoxa australica]
GIVWIWQLPLPNVHCSVHEMRLLWSLLCVSLLVPAQARGGLFSALPENLDEPEELLAASRGLAATARKMWGSISSGDLPKAALASVLLLQGRHISYLTVQLQAFSVAGWDDVREGSEAIGEAIGKARKHIREEGDTYKDAYEALGEVKKDFEAARVEARAAHKSYKALVRKVKQGKASSKDVEAAEAQLEKIQEMLNESHAEVRKVMAASNKLHAFADAIDIKHLGQLVSGGYYAV